MKRKNLIFLAVFIFLTGTIAAGAATDGKDKASEKKGFLSNFFSGKKKEQKTTTKTKVTKKESGETADTKAMDKGGAGGGEETSFAGRLPELPPAVPQVPRVPRAHQGYQIPQITRVPRNPNTSQVTRPSRIPRPTVSPLQAGGSALQAERTRVKMQYEKEALEQKKREREGMPKEVQTTQETQ